MELSKKEFKKEIEFCTYCPKLCHFSCPIGDITGREVDQPWGRQSILFLYLKGYLGELNGETASLFYRCLGCLRCREYCEHEIDIPAIMREVRRFIYKEKIQTVFSQNIELIRNNFIKYGNPYDFNIERKIEELKLERYYIKEVPVVIFPGCDLMRNNPDLLIKLFKIFEILSIDYVGFSDLSFRCCGAYLDYFGLNDLETQNVKKNIELMENIKMLIVLEPHCLWQFKDKYTNKWLMRKKIKFVNVLSFIFEILRKREVKLIREWEKDYYYYDSCYQVRYLDFIEEPRDMLLELTGRKVREFHNNKRDTICCGYGGGFHLLMPEEAKAIAFKTFRDITKSGSTIVGSCSNCIKAIEDAYPESKTIHLIELIYNLLEKK